MTVRDSARTSPSRLIDFLNLGTEFLASRGIDSPRLDAELLLAALISRSRIDLYLRFDQPLTPDEVAGYRELLRRRGNREPLQYLLGWTEWYGRRFEVAPGSLIPRPETEMIIDKAIELRKEQGYRNVLEIGCGTGIIGITLLLEGISARVCAVDIADEAVELTRKNAESLHIPGQLSVLKADAFSASWVPPEPPYDLIVSNPPYIEESVWVSLQPEVRDWEPKLALISGDDGLDAHRQLAALCTRYLGDEGLFIGEMGSGQGERVAEIHRIWSSSVRIEKDLAGHDRIVIARKGRWNE